jgi:hypothetical protein
VSSCSLTKDLVKSRNGGCIRRHPKIRRSDRRRVTKSSPIYHLLSDTSIPMLSAFRKTSFVAVFLLLTFICPAFAWTPFLNDYHPPGSYDYQTQPPDPISIIQQNDIFIADTINDFILYRVQTGQYSTPTGWGFPYSRPPMIESYKGIMHGSRNSRWTPFDQYGSLFAQKIRFPQLAMLARERLEMRGFDVRRLHIFDNGRGIYIRWDIVDPMKHWNYAWRIPGQRGYKPYGYYGGEYNWEGEDACQNESEAICRIESFFRDPIEFFKNY